jgi:hypothetical protein
VPFAEPLVGVSGGVRVSLTLTVALLMILPASGEDEEGCVMMSFVRGRSLVYILSKSSLAWSCVALPNATWWSTRPGRMSASSSFSGWLVVITRTRPSWDATPWVF